MENWQIGVCYGFLTSAIAALSKLTIRKSWLIQQHPHQQRRAQWMRWAGMGGMAVLNPVFDLLAMSYASPSLLAGFSGLALAWIVLGSGLVTGEHPSRSQVAACALIVAGQVLAMGFGDHAGDDQVSIDDIEAVYTKTPSLLQVYFVLMAIWLATLFLWIRNPNTHAIYQRIAWGMSSGSITGLQCFLKDALTLVKRLHTEEGMDDMSSRRRYVLFLWVGALFALAIATALGGLLILTRSMKRYDATFCNAMHSGSFVASVSIMSLVRFDTRPQSPILYAVGLAIILAGVTTLVRTVPVNSNEKDPTTSPLTQRIIQDHEPIKAELLELSSMTTAGLDESSASSSSCDDDDDEESRPMIMMIPQEVPFISPGNSTEISNQQQSHGIARRRTSSATLHVVPREHRDADDQHTNDDAWICEILVPTASSSNASVRTPLPDSVQDLEP